MADGQRKCPDCGSEMVEGFIPDKTFGGMLVPRWLRGSPERSIWTGVKTRKRECRSIDTYRCVKCGLLKSYAIRSIDPSAFWG